MDNENKMFIFLIIIIFILSIVFLYVLMYDMDKKEERLNNACNYCGYSKSTDFKYNNNYDNNYDNMFNPIKLILIECDNDDIIKLYDGIHSIDKWGNNIIINKDVIFCN